MRLHHFSERLLLLVLVILLASPAFASGTPGINLANFSEMVGSWGNNNCVVNSNWDRAPDNFATGDRMNETATSAGHNVYQGLTASGVGNHTASVYVKKGTVDYMQMTGSSAAFGSGQYANFNVDGCSVTHSVNSIASTESSIDGWCRLRYTTNLTTFGGYSGVVIGFIPSPKSIRLPSYAGNTMNMTRVWGLQVERGDVMNGYNSTSQLLLNVPPDNNVPNVPVQFWSDLNDAAIAWNWSFTDYGNATIVTTLFSPARNPTQLFGAGNISVNHSALVGVTTVYSASKWINISAGRFRQGLEPQNLAGLQYFPADHVYNTNIASLPISVNSTAYLNNMSMGPVTSNYLYLAPDVPIYQVDDNITRTAPIIVYSPAGSNGTTFPIPDYADFSNLGSLDDHLVALIDKDHNIKYSLYDGESHGQHVRYPNGTYHAYSTLELNLSSYDIPLGIRADPGSIRYDDVATGNLTHAIGIAVNSTRNSGNIWPIRFVTGTNTSQWTPPQGTRLRLRQNFTVHNYTPIQQHILNGLKNYGAIIVDNNGKQTSWWFGGKCLEKNATLIDEIHPDTFTGRNASNPDWVLADDFEIVNETSLMISEDSGKVLGGTSPTTTITHANPQIWNWYCPAGRFCLGPFILWAPSMGVLQ